MLTKLAMQHDQTVEQADEHLRAARNQFSKAALSCMRGAGDATAQVRAALELVEEARAALRGLSEIPGEE